MREIWKDIEEYKGLYQISNYGRIKGVKRNILKKTQLNQDGYLRVTLCKDGIQKIYSVHRLVAQAFIDNWNYTLQVDHINNCRTDNRVENLRMSTPSENIYNPNSNITKGVRIYFNDGTIKEFASSKKTAEYLNCSANTIRTYIKRNNSSPKYNFYKIEHIH